VKLTGSPESGEIWRFPTFINIDIFVGLRKIRELASAVLSKASISHLHR
jgi:hypothetical protein